VGNFLWLLNSEVLMTNVNGLSPMSMVLIQMLIVGVMGGAGGFD